MGGLSESVSGVLCVNRVFCRYGLLQGAAPKMPGCSCSASILRCLWASVVVSVVGFFHPVFPVRCSRKSVWCFHGRLGGARHAHLRRSSAGLVAHGLWSFCTARTAFLKTFLCVWWGYVRMFLRSAFSGVGMGVSDGVTE